MQYSSYKLKKFLFSTVIVALLIFQSSGAFAAGTNEPTGPQHPTGVTQATGTTEATGTTQPTGVPENNQSVTPTATSDQTENNSQPQVLSTPPQISIPDTIEETFSTETSSNPVTGSGSVTNISTGTSSEINNNLGFNLNSGGNTIGGNTITGNIETGDVEGTVNVLNLGNSVLGSGSTFSTQNIFAGDGDIILDSNGNAIDISGSNQVTGPGSENSNIFGNNNIVAIFQNNDASAENNINIDAITGNNTIENNTYVGDLTTGDINLGVNLVNILNVYRPDLALTVDVWNILGDVNGDITFANNTTGNGSNNQNNYDGNQDIDISNIQNSDTDNLFSFDLNTGENEIGVNTATGNIATGSVDARTNIANISNVGTPMYYLLNVYGEWDGDYGGLDPSRVIVNVINADTGPDSNNQNNIIDNKDVDVSMINNASASNNITVHADTGHNRANNNTVLGNITTGDIKISENVVNILNSFDKNVTKFALGIINIFGSWKHKHKPGPSNNPTSETPQPVPEADIPITITIPIAAVLGTTKTMNILPAAGYDATQSVNSFKSSNSNTTLPVKNSEASNSVYALILFGIALTLIIINKTSAYIHLK